MAACPADPRLLIVTTPSISHRARAVPSTPTESVALRDGSHVAIRAIARGDAEALHRAFEKLSPQSRYRRFFTFVDDLSPERLAYFTDVDHHDHEALIATTDDPDEIVGVARYIRLASDPSAAEVAVTVIDSWQGRGVASALLAALVERARREGVAHFEAICLPGNHDAIDVLEALGPTREHWVDGAEELDIDLKRVESDAQRETE
jgi:RimJ/RimL family protein N-acetyltransferase